MKILILGSSGMLGTAIENICKENGIKYISLTHSDIEATNSIELENAIKKHNPTVIINCIAIVGINPCEEDKIQAYKVNTLIPYELAKIADTNDITLVHISTHAVFDGNNDDFYTEDDIAEPLNIYGATKLEADILVQKRCKKHYIVRVPTMFGERRNNSIGFVDKMLLWMQERSNIRVADDKIDTPTYSKDVAKEIMYILQNNKKYGLYHIANSGKVSYFDFVAKIKDIKNLQCDLIRAKDSDFKALAPKPLKTALLSKKLEPLRHWEDALKEYLSERI